jgi:predicted RecB family nuclease
MRAKQFSKRILGELTEADDHEQGRSEKQRCENCQDMPQCYMKEAALV